MQKYLKKSVVLLGLLSAISAGVYYYQKSVLIAQAESNLTTIVRQHVEQLRNYFKSITEKNELFAMSDSTKELFLQQPQTPQVPENVTLITAKGIIFASHHKKAQLGTQILMSDLYSSALEKTFTTTSMTVTSTLYSTTYDPFLQKPALVVASPVIANKKLLGITLKEHSLGEALDLISYEKLGSTGDIVIGKKGVVGDVFVNNTRHPLSEQARQFVTSTTSLAQTQGQRIPTSLDDAKALHDAIRGTTGTFIGYDYRGKEVLSVSAYIPEVAWGIVAQQDIAEILSPAFITFNFLIALIVALIIACALLCTTYISGSLLISGLITLGALLSIVGFLLHQEIRLIKKEALLSLTTRESEKITTIAEEVTTSYARIESRAHACLNDYTHTMLDGKTSIKRIERDLNHFDMIGAIALIDKKTNKVFYGYKEGSLIRTSALSEEQEKNACWNTLMASEQGSWHDMVQEPHSFNKTAVFAIDSTTASVWYFYNTLYLEKIIHRLKTEQEEFVMVLSSTMQPIIKSDLNQSLIANLIQEISTTTSTSGTREFGSELLFYKKTPKLNWTIVSTSPTASIPLPVKHLASLYLIMIVILALAGGCYITAYGLYARWRLSTISTFVALFFTIALGLLWHTISTISSYSPAERFSITTTSERRKIIEKLDDEAMLRRSTLVTPIPTGIMLQEISITPFQIMFVAGHMWQKYNLEDHKNIARGVRIAQALKSNFVETYRSQADGIETIGWDFTLEMAAPEADVHYPFDCKKFDFKIEHPDKTKNILLVPDLESYTSTAPEKNPGIGRTVTVTGFQFVKSFFNYQPTTMQATVVNRTPTPILAFTALAQRQLMDSLVMYLLPLFIIILALFIIAHLAEFNKEKNPELEFFFSIFNIYTALFFTLILMHRSLRTEMPTGGEILYLEYFFFSTYLTILVLLIIAIAAPRGIIYNTRYGKFSLVSHLYWPLQTLVFLVATLWMFY